MGSFPSITVKVVSEQLLHMCERGDSTAVASLLHNSAKTYSERIMCEIINARHYVQISPVLGLGKREVTALLLACQLGFEDVVRVLLQYNAWVNTHPCPLNVACANGHVGVVKALLTCPYLMVQGVGGSATIYDWGHCPPLFDACRHGHAEIAQLLLEHGADPNDPYVYALSESEYDCLHPLQAACHCSYIEVVPVLLNHGANIPAGLLKIGSCPASVQNILVSYIEEKDFVKLARASKLTMLMGHHPRTGKFCNFFCWFCC